MPEAAREQAAKLGYALPIVAGPTSVTPQSLGFTNNQAMGMIVADASGKVIYNSNGASCNEEQIAVVKALRDAGIWQLRHNLFAL